MTEIPDINDKDNFANKVYSHLLEMGVPIQEADEWLFDFFYMKEDRPRPGTNIKFDLIRQDPEFGDQEDRTDNDYMRTKEGDERFGTQDVDSSHMATIGYDSKNGVMELRFKNGSVYRYLNIPQELFAKLKQSPSKGKFFHKYIRGNDKFKVAQVEEKSLECDDSIEEYVEVDEEKLLPQKRRGYQDPVDLDDDDVKDKGFIPRDKEGKLDGTDMKEKEWK